MQRITNALEGNDYSLKGYSNMAPQVVLRYNAVSHVAFLQTGGICSSFLQVKALIYNGPTSDRGLNSTHWHQHLLQVDQFSISFSRYDKRLLIFDTYQSPSRKSLTTKHCISRAHKAAITHLLLVRQQETTRYKPSGKWRTGRIDGSLRKGIWKGVFEWGEVSNWLSFPNTEGIGEKQLMSHQQVSHEREFAKQKDNCRLH